MEDEEKNQNINQVDIIQKILNLKIIQKKIQELISKKSKFGYEKRSKKSRI